LNNFCRILKISENILFVLEYTELIGIIQLLTTLLLSNGPVKPKTEKDNFKIPVLPQTVVSATILGIKILNNIARIDLILFQVNSNFKLNIILNKYFRVFVIIHCFKNNYSIFLIT
jgi:hypothetical protein